MALTDCILCWDSDNLCTCDPEEKLEAGEYNYYKVKNRHSYEWAKRKIISLKKEVVLLENEIKKYELK